MMTEREIDPPPAWNERPGSEQRDSMLFEYQHETGDETAFIVSVLDRSADSEEYELRLSTIDRPSSHYRHDYPVDEYDSRSAAIAGGEACMEHVLHQLETGRISSEDPDVEEIRSTIGTSGESTRSRRTVASSTACCECGDVTHSG